MHFAFHLAGIQPEQMYRKSNQSDLTPEKFELPVALELSFENRWVIMAELIPWSELARSLAEETSAGVEGGFIGVIFWMPSRSALF